MSSLKFFGHIMTKSCGYSYWNMHVISYIFHPFNNNKHDAKMCDSYSIHSVCYDFMIASLDFLHLAVL